MVQADIMGFAHSGRGLVEHMAKRWAIDVACMDSKADDFSCELVHDEKNPVGL